MGGGQGHTEDRVRPQLRLVQGSVELQHALVDGALVQRLGPSELRGDQVVHAVARGEHALAAEPLRVAVAELEGLVLAGRRAGGDPGAAEGPILQEDVDLDGRVPSGVQDLPSMDALDEWHDTSILGSVGGLLADFRRGGRRTGRRPPRWPGRV
jgi:hypothetical protein